MEKTALQLLAEIEAFVAEADMSETAFGLAALNDGAFVGRLRAGMDIRASTIDRCRDYMRSWRVVHRGAPRSRPSRAVHGACAS